jgi:HSP20 family protein
MRNLTRFPSTDPISKIQKKVNRMYEDLTSFQSYPDLNLDEMGYYIPKADVIDTNESFEIAIDLPGLSKNDIKIQVTGNQLIVEGKRDGHIVKSGRKIRKERNTGKFQRNFTLSGIDSNASVKATFKEGILRLSVPKSKKPGKAIKIEVK